MNVKALLKPSPARYDAALAIVRVVVGIIFFVHGWQKLFVLSVAGVGGFFATIGIPAAPFMAGVVTIVELVGGLMLIAGAGTRIAGVLLAIDMLVAFYIVHLPNGFYVSEGGYEFVFVLMAACIGFVLSGSGKYSVDEALTG